MTTTVTVREAADLLGVSPDVLYSAFRDDGYVAAGPIRLHPIRCGKRLLVGRAAIDEFCAAIATEPASDTTDSEGDVEPTTRPRRPGVRSLNAWQAPTGFRGARRVRGAGEGKPRRSANPIGGDR